MQSGFLTNYSELSFLNKIKESLQECKSFYFSVSFIKKAGLVLLIKDIELALQRGATGRVITSTYQNFTDIESLNSFYMLMNKYENFDCHLDYNSFSGLNKETLGYHSKGYLFEFDDGTEIVVGSSNITRNALLKNIEWDLVVEEPLDGDTYKQAKEEFDDKFICTEKLTTKIIETYAKQINYAIERWDMDYDIDNIKLKPNYMQIKALKELNRYRAMGVSRALVVSAAGSGKTYLAAFDAYNFNPKRLLYIVHEGSILRKALETFHEVFGNTVSYGFYVGKKKELTEDFLFATNVSMCKTLDLFDKKEFDYIVIDECHHSTASTYKQIIDYFEPEFLLGLTATPERMDNQDVFEQFDKNVPYELRLRDAIVNNLVVPFHYYGIRDSLVEYGLSREDERLFVNQLSSTEHVDFIKESIESHKPEGKLKALAFCRDITHARKMSEAFSKYYNTACLTGKNDIGERIRTYEELQSDTGKLEILFTVDILNEGVDIPGVNMVLFLRPTESSTIFIQQLGRGLRKYQNKEYVTVLDFIGNSYKRSVQIAFALCSLSSNFVIEKRLMESLVKDDFTKLGLDKYGVEINIDKLSKEEILKYIDNENFNAINYVKQDYFNFKKYINSEFYPKHMDYLNNDCAPDLIRFFNIKSSGKKNCSYYNFLKSIDETDLPTFTDNQIKFVNYLSLMLPIVRKHEFLIFKCLIEGVKNKEEIYNILNDEIDGLNRKTFDHALTYIYNNKFVTEHEGKLSLNIEIDTDLKEYLEDLITYGFTRYSVDFSDDEDFKLWANYRKDQALLKMCLNPGYTQKGTVLFNNDLLIFAALKKDEAIQDHLKYKDKFTSENIFQWECEAGLNEENKQKLINSNKAYLFIRKVENENGIVLPFTYVGTGKLTNPRKNEDNPKNTLLFDIVMDNTLPEYLQYDFLLEKQTN